MNAEVLFKLVVEMREAQRRYFRHRSGEDLERSKSLEKRVDLALREYLAAPSLPFGD
jgi:hypothetical protein